MKNYPNLPIPLAKNETVYGICWLVISQLLLPAALSAGNALLAAPLSLAGLNFLYYCINFAAVVWIFRRFLAQSWKLALKIPFPVIWYAILGYLGSDLLTDLVSLLIYRLDPSFFNINNQAVLTMLDQDHTLMVIGTVILVPVAEELLYRGVLFRGLYDKSRVRAYIVSIVLFAAIHVLGYIGTYSPLQLLLALVQYVPAGYCLCWAYRQTGTIAAPMLMHALVNAMSIYNAVR